MTAVGMMLAPPKAQRGQGGGGGWRGAWVVTAALLWVLLVSSSSSSRTVSALPVRADEGMQGTHEDEGDAWAKQGHVVDTLTASQQGNGDEATQAKGTPLTDNTEMNLSSETETAAEVGRGSPLQDGTAVESENGEQQSPQRGEEEGQASAHAGELGGNPLAAPTGHDAVHHSMSSPSSHDSSLGSSTSTLDDGADAADADADAVGEETPQERAKPAWKKWDDDDGDSAQDQEAQHDEALGQEGTATLASQGTGAEERDSPGLRQQVEEQQQGAVDWAAGVTDHRDEPVAAGEANDEENAEQEEEGRYDEHRHHLPNQAGFLSGQPSVRAAETTEERTVEIALNNADGSRVSSLGFSISGGAEYSNEPLRIVQVVPGSAAATAGLHTDDQVISVQGKDMQGATQEDGTRAISSIVNNEQEPTLTLVVKGQALSSAAHLKQAQDQGQAMQDDPSASQAGNEVVTAAPDTPQISSDDTFLEVHVDTSQDERVGLSAAEMAEGDARYIKVTAVAPGSPAARAGILAGDKVLSVDSTPVSTLDDLKAAIAGAESSRVRVQLWRSPQHDGNAAARVSAQADVMGPSPARDSEVGQGQQEGGAPHGHEELGMEAETRRQDGNVGDPQEVENREERQAAAWDGGSRTPGTRQHDVDLDVGGSDAEEQGAERKVEHDASKEADTARNAVEWEDGMGVSPAQSQDAPQTETQSERQEPVEHAQGMETGFESDAETASRSRGATGSSISTGEERDAAAAAAAAQAQEEEEEEGGADDDAGADSTGSEALQRLRSKENRLEAEYLQRHTGSENNLNNNTSVNADTQRESSSSSSRRIGGVRKDDATSWGDDDDQELAEEMAQEKQWEAQLQAESSQGQQQAGQQGDQQGLAASQTQDKSGPGHEQAERKPEWESWHGTGVTAEEEEDEGAETEEKLVGEEEKEKQGGDSTETVASNERQEQEDVQGMAPQEGHDQQGSELEDEGVRSEEGGEGDEAAGETWHREVASDDGRTSGTTTTAVGGGGEGSTTTTTTTTTTTATTSAGRDLPTTTDAEVIEEEGGSEVGNEGHSQGGGYAGGASQDKWETQYGGEVEQGEVQQRQQEQQEQQDGGAGDAGAEHGDGWYKAEEEDLDQSRMGLRERVSSLREQFDEDLATMNREEATLKASEEGKHKHSRGSGLDNSQPQEKQQQQQQQQRKSYETSAGRGQEEAFERDAESSGFPMIGVFMIFAVLLVIGLMYQRKIKSVVLGGGSTHNGRRHRTYSRRRR